MVLPESNLPPEAQKWRRAVEKALTDLQRRTGALQTNTKTTGARFSSLLTQTSAVERQVGETIDDLTEVAEKVEHKDQSVWQPKAPVDPEHGQRWFDTTDGNVLRVWIDYGDYARYNYARNPSFSTDTNFWSAIGATLARTVGPDPMAQLDVPEDVGEPRDVVLVETEGRSHGEWLEGDPDNPDSGPSGFVGSPWAAGIDVQVVSGNEGVRAILDVINDDDEVVSTSGPVEVSASTITRVLATPVEGENILEDVRVRLTVTNLSGGDTVFADKVMLEAVTDTEGDYFDGDMPGVGWVEHPEAGRVSEWLGYPDWYELQDEKLKNEVYETTDEIREDLDQAVADLAATQEWVDETGQELVQRVGSAEGAISTVEDVLGDVRSNVGRKMWSGDSFTSAGGTFTVEPVGSGRLRIAHVEGTSPVPVRYLCGSNGWNESFDGAVVVVEVPEPGTYSVVAFDDPDATVGSDILANFVVTAEMMAPDYGSWVDMELPDIDWSDAEIGLDQLRDAGLLDPDVWARLFEDVVVGGVVAATEAFIGSNAIIDNAVQARHIVASETLWAKLAAFVRVTTDMLLVGGMNLLPDPRFEDPELTAGRVARSAATEVADGYQATDYFYWVPSDTPEDVRRYAVPVTEGDTYRIEVPVTLTSPLSSTPRLETWNASATGRTLRTATDWTYQDGILSYTFKVPEGVAYLSPVIYRTTSYTVHPGARVTLMADSRLLVDGAVTARALNVVHELPSGDMLRIDPDGVRVWRGGNDGPHPNIALTAGDGFRIQTDTGDGLLWIDPATGDLHTDGAVVSGGTITGSSFEGGQIELRTPAGAPIFSADQYGVSVGGEEQIYTRATYTTTASSGAFAEDVPVVGGTAYKFQFRLERSAAVENQTHDLDIFFRTSTGAMAGWAAPVWAEEIPVYDQGTIREVVYQAPPNAATFSWEFSRTTGAVTTRISDIAVDAIGPGEVVVGGAVKAMRGVFNTLALAEPVTVGGRQFLRDSGWEPLELLADWSANFPARRRRIDDQVFLSGEIICSDSAAGTGRPITVLPEGWRPPHRVRLPWGWGATLTSIVIEADGTVWSLSGARTSTPGMHLNAVRFFIN